MPYKDVEKKFIERTWEPVTYDFPEVWYVPCFQKNPDGSRKNKDGTIDDFPGYPNFVMEISMACHDEQMVASYEPDYILVLTGHFKATTKPFVKKIFIEDGELE